MNLLGARPRLPTDAPSDITVRALGAVDWAEVRRIYAEGIATGHATFETTVPDRRELDRKWLPDHRWVAEVDGRIALSPTSSRPVYAGVATVGRFISGEPCELSEGREEPPGSSPRARVCV